MAAHYAVRRPGCAPTGKPAAGPTLTPADCRPPLLGATATPVERHDVSRFGMETAVLIAAGWTSGINAYLTVLILGLAGRLGWSEGPDALQSTPVLVVCGLLFALEFVVDKIPLADNVWDLVHTAVRPTVGALVGSAVAGAQLGRPQAALLAASLALVAHLSKASTRLAINASPEPFSNIAASLTEDSVVATLMVLAVTRPWVAAGISVLAMVVFATVAVLLLSLARRGYRMVRRGLGRPRPSTTG